VFSDPAQSPLFTGAGAWIQVDDTQYYQDDTQAFPSSDQEGYQSQHAPRLEPWTHYAVVGINHEQVACPLPIAEPRYGLDPFRSHSGPPFYSPSTMWSGPSEVSSRPVQGQGIGTDFASHNSMEAQAPTYAQVAAQAGRQQEIFDPNLLTPNWPYQPENDNFINSTVTDIRSSRTPSIVSRTSGGAVSRPRKPPRITIEPREGPYPCNTCSKKFGTPGERK
jgi:hypothetical protein